MDKELELALLERELRRRRKQEQSTASETTPDSSTFGRGALQGATYGMADEGSGVVNTILEAGNRALNTVGLADESPGQVAKKLENMGITGDIGPSTLSGSYKEARDEERAANLAASQESPGKYAMGSLVGAIAAPSPVPGAGLVTKGAVEGGLAGLGASNDSSITGMAVDTAGGAALGGIGGKVAGYLTNKFNPENLKKSAGELAKQATQATGSQVSRFDDDAGRYLLDNKLLGYFSTPESIAKKASAKLDDINSTLDSSLSQLADRGATVDRAGIIDQLNKKIFELSADESQPQAVRELTKLRDDIAATVNIHGSTVPIDVAEKTKRGFQSQISPNSYLNPDKSVALKSTQGMYRQAVEDAATQVDPALASKFKEAKKAYGVLEPVQEAVAKRAATLQQSPAGGLLDTAAASPGIFSGSIGTALGIPVLRRAVAPRMKSFAAKGTDDIASIVQKVPPKFRQQFSDAMAKGPSAVAIQHYLLYQRDPEYQAHMMGEEDTTEP